MPAQSEWLRVMVTAPLVGVDRDNRVLRGMVLAQEGPFKTAGRGEFDKDSLKAILKLAKARPSGLKSRFTHPTESDDGLGKFLGRVREVQMSEVVVERDGQRLTLGAVRGNLYLDPTSFRAPSGNLGDYVLDLAESDPEALSASLVLQTEKAFRLEKDGTPKKDDKGNVLPPLWRPTKLHAADVVDEGDAVDGILSVERLPNGLPWQATEALDALFSGQAREVVEERCLAWLGKYLDYRYGPQSLPSVDALRRKLRLKEVELGLVYRIE